MTTLSRIVLVTVAALSLSACDFLDKEPETSISNDAVFTGATGAEAAINGAYNRTQGPMDDFVIFSDLAADFAQHTGSYPSWTEIDVHLIPTGSVEVSQQYTAWYALINQANVIIENVEGTPGLSPTRTNQILGEAYTFRAYALHNLVRWFGPVPIVLQAVTPLDDANVARSSVDEVYDQILEDLQTAEPLVAESRSVGFIDRDVVRALRARVLLYDGQYAAAGVLAAELAAAYPLVALDALYDALNSSESIWELQYTTDDSNSMAFFGFVNGGRFEYGPTPTALAAYGEDDARADYALAEDGNQTVVGKYFRVNTGADHHFLIRGAEMVLIQAEAAAHADDYDEAVRLVNVVRERAGAEPIDDATITTQAQAIDLILDERALELAYEGHRWHDLVRTGRAVATLETLTTENFTRWPIPQREIDINEALTQNPGY